MSDGQKGNVDITFMSEIFATSRRLEPRLENFANQIIREIWGILMEFNFVDQQDSLISWKS